MTIPPLPSHSGSVQDAPAELDRGAIELYRELDAHSYLEACCHILKRPQGTSNNSTPPWTLCGLVLHRPPHTMTGDATCPTCGRPRCPECHTRFGAGQR